MTISCANQPKPQATRYTPQEFAYLAYWESRGYTFGPGEKPPMNTVTPPGHRESFQARHPIIDAVAGSLVLALVFGAMAAIWIWSAAK